MLLHYPCTDVEKGDLQYPGELFATWPSEAGRQGRLEPPHFLCLPFQHHIIMTYACTHMRTISMQTARKTAGTDSASSSI